MEPFRHRLCNSILGKPAQDHVAAGNKVNVDDLPVLQGLIGGMPVNQSYWRPTAAEVAKLNRDGCIAVTILGPTHAPIKLEVIETVLPEISAPSLVPTRATQIIRTGL